ncbi:hypothetical protein ACP70R_008980 [Stipagrostis hirtigluma subsp. patula]
MAAAPLLFYDLSLLPSSSAAADATSSSRLLLAAARALELGYAGVALDHPHRGLLADSTRCRTSPFPALSSLPLPPAAALHRRRLASPVSEPFRQYTRITLSLDSAAAAASALAPSAARLLRTYDLVAARPLTQAAFDHLCQVQCQQLDLISIDFSRRLPFRLKLPMVKIALQRGLHFEIAYSPIISADDINSRRNLLSDAKLLVDWTKGKNIIISSAAHTATEIRGPYDVINLCAYLLGLPMQRAKAAISTNCRSLISKALRKKHFYKETIRIDRLLPNENLNSTEIQLGDWIGWDSVSCKGDLQSSEANLEPSSNKDERPSSPLHGVTEVLHEKPPGPDVSVFGKLSEQSSDIKEIPAETQEENVHADRGYGLSLGHQNAVLDEPENSEVVLDQFAQPGARCAANLKNIDEHVDFVQDAMEVDGTQSCRLNLVAGRNAPLSSDVKLASCALPQGTELFDTSLEDKGNDQSSDILDNPESYASGEKEKTPLDHEAPSGSDVCLVDKDMYQCNAIPVDIEAYRDTPDLLECPRGRDDEAPSSLALHFSHNSCEDFITPQQVMEGKIKQSMHGNSDQTLVGEVEPFARKTRTVIQVEPNFHGQESSSTDYIYDTRSGYTSYESDELKEQSPKEISSLEKISAKTHEQLLNYSYPSGKVEMSTIGSGDFLKYC